MWFLIRLLLAPITIPFFCFTLGIGKAALWSFGAMGPYGIVLFPFLLPFAVFAALPEAFSLALAI